MVQAEEGAEFLTERGGLEEEAVLSGGKLNHNWQVPLSRHGSKRKEIRQQETEEGPRWGTCLTYCHPKFHPQYPI